MLVWRRLIAVPSAVALAGAAGAAAAADAATIRTTRPCVPNLGIGGAETLALVGSGFTPNGVVSLRTTTPSNSAQKNLATIRADAGGNLARGVDPPAFNTDRTVQQSFNLIAVDTANPSNTATTTFRQVRFGFEAKPSTGRPTRTVTYTARGFVADRPVYAHFRFGGRTRRSVRLGVARAPCGIVARRMRLLPTKLRFGTWTVYMDQAPTYSRSTSLQARGSLVIERTQS